VSRWMKSISAPSSADSAATFAYQLPIYLAARFPSALPADLCVNGSTPPSWCQKFIESEVHSLPQDAILLERYPLCARIGRERTTSRRNPSRLCSDPAPRKPGIASSNSESRSVRSMPLQRQQIPRTSGGRHCLDRNLDCKAISPRSLPAGS